MGLIEFLVLLAVAGVCGSLGQAITGTSGKGCLVSIALGFIGALIGSWLGESLGLPRILTLDLGDGEFPLVWSILGAAIFVAVIQALSPERRRKKD